MRHRTNDQDTSVAAAKSVEPTLTQKRMAVLELLRNAGPRGLTDYEIAQNWPQAPESTYRKRRSELADMGLVADSGRREKRGGPTNRIVWVLNEFTNDNQEAA